MIDPGGAPPEEATGLVGAFVEDLIAVLPFLVTIVVVAAILWASHWLLIRRRKQYKGESQAGRQAIMLGLSVAALLAIILALPVEPAMRQQLVGLFGLVLTAVIGLASTTFVSNAMAGLMLRAVRSFKPGDFVRVGEEFGRVTERGLFHTEIQTRDRDLTTLPNMYLVSNPVTVVRESGTVVSCSLSLGYDESHGKIETLLQEAATDAELQDPFVRIMDLGDYSITYRVAGFLPDVKHLLTARSNLRKRVLDKLHGAGVEIVSPSFMNQRPLTPDVVVIPDEPTAPAPAAKADEASPESKIFDKADQAVEIETLKTQRGELVTEAGELEKEIAATAKDERGPLEGRLARLRHQVEAIDAKLEDTGDE